MSDFQAKMYQIQFRLSLQRSPEPLAGLRGPTSKGRGRKGDGRGRGWREWEGEGEGDGRGKGRGGGEGKWRRGSEGEGGEATPSRPPLIHISGYAPDDVDNGKDLRSNTITIETVESVILSLVNYYY